MRGLDGKTAVITGAASGIGAASAHRLAEEGVDVVVTDVDEAGGNDVVDRIESDDDASGSAYFRELDVRDYDAVQAVLEEAHEKTGRLDILFNNAGIGEMQGFEETTREHMENIMDVNVSGVWNGCHAALAIMKENGGGSIINTASMAGWKPSEITSYGMSKAAVLHFSKSIANEVGQYGIRVNAVCPGLIDTQMTRTWFTDEMREEGPKQTALNRWGEPEEIAAGVAFLASEDASYITGRDLRIDAGH